MFRPGQSQVLRPALGGGNWDVVRGVDEDHDLEDTLREATVGLVAKAISLASFPQIGLRIV